MGDTLHESYFIVVCEDISSVNTHYLIKVDKSVVEGNNNLSFWKETSDWTLDFLHVLRDKSSGGHEMNATYLAQLNFTHEFEAGPRMSAPTYRVLIVKQTIYYI